MTTVTNRIETEINARDNASAAFMSAKGNFEKFIDAVRMNGLAFVFVGQEVRNWSNQIRQSVDDSVKKYADFDKAMTQFSVLATDSGTKAKGMANEINAMGIQFGISSTEVAEAARDVAAMGIGLSDSMVILREGTKLAVGGLSEVGAASTIIVNTMKQFQLDVSKAGHISDVFAATANKTAANVSDLSISMQYAGPIAAAMGVSLEELAAAMGLMRNAGLEASIVGTNLRQMLVQLQAPTKEATAAMVDAGLSLRYETDLGRSLSAQIKSLNSSIRTLKSSQEDLSIATDTYRGRLEDARSSQDRHQRAIRNIDKDLMRHNSTYRSLEREVRMATSSLSSMDEQLRMLQGQYDQTGRQINNLTIEMMLIERRASSEGRELTESEIADINRLRGSMDDLRITQMRQSASIDINRDRMDEQSRAMRNAQAAQEKIKDDAIEPHEKALRSLDKTIEKMEDAISENTKTMRENASSIKENEKALDSVTAKYIVSGGQMKTIAEIVREIHRVTKGMTEAQKEAFLNTILGIRGMAAFNTINQIGVENLEVLTRELEASSDAFGGVGYATNASNEMLKNASTRIEQVNQKMDVFSKEAGRGAIATSLTLRGTWADLLLQINGTSPVVARTVGIFGDLVSSLGQVVAQYLIFYPIIMTSKAAMAAQRAQTELNTVATTKNSAAVTVNTGLIRANATALVLSNGVYVRSTTIKRANATAVAVGTMANRTNTGAITANTAVTEAAAIWTGRFTAAKTAATIATNRFTAALIGGGAGLLGGLNSIRFALVAASVSARGFMIAIGPVGWAILAITAIITAAFLIWQNWPAISKAAGDAAKWLGDGFNWLGQRFGDVAEGIKGQMAGVGEAIWNSTEGVRNRLSQAAEWFAPIGAQLGRTAELVGSIFGRIGHILQIGVQRIGENVGRILSDAWENAQRNMRAAGEEISRGLDGIRERIQGGIDGVVRWFGNARDAVIGFLRDTGILRGLEWLNDRLNDIGRFIRDQLVRVWNSLTDAVSAAQRAFNGLGDWIRNGLTSFLDGFNDWLEGVDDWLRGIEDSLTGHSVVPAFEELHGALKTIMGSGFTGYLETMKSGLGGLETKSVGATPRVSPIAAMAEAAIDRSRPSFSQLPQGISQSTETTTVRNTTNAPVINIMVKNLDFNDPRTLDALGAAIKKVVERA